MKKLLITLTLFFTTLTSKAQEAFEGVWTMEGSTYKTRNTSKRIRCG